MKGIFYTIINPLKFMTYNYLKGKFINYGFPEEAVHINLITKEEMTIEVELYFKIIEVGKKFYDKFNGKSFGIGNDYKLNTFIVILHGFILIMQKKNLKRV